MEECLFVISVMRTRSGLDQPLAGLQSAPPASLFAEKAFFPAMLLLLSSE